MIVSKVLAACWIVVGVFLCGLASAATMAWLPDWFQIRYGISWTEFVSGTIALMCGIALPVQNAIGRWTAMTLSSLVALYLLAYLAFGGEGHVAIRLLIPLLVLVMCIATFIAARSRTI
jgi:uncharacterized membrane protein YfhO